MTTKREELREILAGVIDPCVGLLCCSKETDALIDETLVPILIEALAAAWDEGTQFPCADCEWSTPTPANPYRKYRKAV